MRLESELIVADIYSAICLEAELQDVADRHSRWRDSAAKGELSCRDEELRER